MTNNHPLAAVRDDAPRRTMSVMARLGAVDAPAPVNVHLPVWRERVAAWEPWLRAGTSGGTTGLRLYHILRMGSEVTTSPEEITADEIVDWIVSHDWTPNTRRSYRASIRAFFTWMNGKGYRPDNPGAVVPKQPIPRKGARPAPEAVIARALAGLEPDEPLALAIRLGAECGLRCGEIARAHATQVETHDGMHWLRVKGKGGHERMVPMPDDLALIIRDLRGWVWPNHDNPREHVDSKWVGTRVARELNRHVDVGARVTTHALRHRFASRAYAAGTDLPAVQNLLGHAKPETTMQYTWIPEDNLTSAAKGAWL